VQGGNKNIKSLIIYFSQTGNTRRVAKCIQGGIIDLNGQCDITDLNDVDVKLLSDYDLVGIGCPVFYYKEPFNEFLGQVMPKLGIDNNKCAKCHACEINCPVQGINIEEDPPRIQTPCIYCFHCVNICPSLAISAKWDKLVSIAPMYYARYRKVLDEAAAQGQFRWLVDPETINFDDPLYKQRERNIKRKIKSKETDSPN